VRLPQANFLGYLKAGDATPVHDPSEAVVAALSAPIGTPLLRRMVRPGARVALVVPDRTRPMPLNAILRPVLEELERGGVASHAITIVVALGSHRPMTAVELSAMLGEDVVRQYRVENHDWAAGDLVDLGVTPLGIPIRVNRTVWEADVKVGISSVKPHRSAGWSGGGKIIDPGVCGAETVGMTHWRSVAYTAEQILGIAENPIRHEIERVAERVGLGFSVNVVLNRHGGLVHASAGHPVLAHRAAVPAADALYRVASGERADVLISGTAPWARDLWAGVAGLFLAEYFVRPGGTVVVAAPCPDGIAAHHPEILEFGYRPPKEIEALVNAGRFTDLAAASHMAVVGGVLFDMGVGCTLISDGISQSVSEKLGLRWSASVQEATDAAVARYGSHARVLVCRAEDVADMLVLPRRESRDVAA
jgi:nickel-dependent lactate racemase